MTREIGSVRERNEKEYKKEIFTTLKTNFSSSSSSSSRYDINIRYMIERRYIIGDDIKIQWDFKRLMRRY